MPESRHKQYAHSLVGVVDTTPQLFHACEALRDAGYRHFDAMTPFPVHGLERAMGLRPSRIPWISLAGAAFGFFGMVWLAWYSQEAAYPGQIISGKLQFSWQAFIPLFFEMTVLFSGLATFFGLWALNRQPQFFHPVFTHPLYGGATDNRFLVAVELRDPKYDPAATRALLEKHGVHDLLEVFP
jgi:ActD protein